MGQSRDESLPSRVELVVLACLSQKKPPSDTELGEAVQQLIAPGDSAEAARRRATELLAGLVRRAWVTLDDEAPRQRKSESSRKLTKSGKLVLRNAFRLSRAPTWAQVRDKHLPALALGIPAGSERAKKVCTETALTATVLGDRYGVRDAFTPMAVCDALIADLLGMPRGQLTLDRIRAHMLLRRIDRSSKDMPSSDEKGYAGKLATWIACSTVGVSEDPRKVSRALGRRWVSGEPQLSVKASPDIVLVQPQQPLPPGPPPPQQTAANLLDVVRDTIPRVGAEGRFGEKVYVSAI